MIRPPENNKLQARVKVAFASTLWKGNWKCFYFTVLCWLPLLLYSECIKHAYLDIFWLSLAPFCVHVWLEGGLAEALGKSRTCLFLLFGFRWEEREAGGSAGGFSWPAPHLQEMESLQHISNQGTKVRKDRREGHVHLFSSYWVPNTTQALLIPPTTLRSGWILQYPHFTFKERDSERPGNMPKVTKPEKWQNWDSTPAL